MINFDDFDIEETKPGNLSILDIVKTLNKKGHMINKSDRGDFDWFVDIEPRIYLKNSDVIDLAMEEKILENINFDDFDIEEKAQSFPDKYINYVNSMYSRKKCIIRVKAEDISHFANVLYKNDYIWNSGKSPLDIRTYEKRLDGFYYIALIVLDDMPKKRIINSEPSYSENIIDYDRFR